ncbi:18499_t:CDS:2, partial [Funneliformis geosporum]
VRNWIITYAVALKRRNAEKALAKGDNMVIDSNTDLEEIPNIIDFNDNNEFILQEILNISDISKNYKNDNEYNDEYGRFFNGLYRDFMNL